MLNLVINELERQIESELPHLLDKPLAFAVDRVRCSCRSELLIPRLISVLKENDRHGSTKGGEIHHRNAR